MRKLATMTAAAALMLGFAMSMGTSGALAGGSSDTTGSSYHCYLFFHGFPAEVGFEFAQVMMNADDSGSLIELVGKALDKYVDLGGHVHGSLGDCE